jgi:hypothetical protein
LLFCSNGIPYFSASNLQNPYMVKQESHVLSEVFNSTRGLTKYFISQLDKDKLENRHKLDTVELNSAYWIISHLVWAEYTLALRSLNGPVLDIPWINHYRIGSEGTLLDDRPAFGELMAIFDQVHDLAQEHIRSLTTEQLDEVITLENIGWEATVRRTIHHAIRHEGSHIGHLSWICKLDGIKTM